MLPISRPGALLIAVALVTAAPPLTGRAQDLTVESAVTSLPSLIGTSPSGLAWSPDGSQLAFLWNDEGMPFRDVWIVSAEGGEPRRITDLKGDAPPPAEDSGSMEALKRVLRYRTRGGVSQVVWTPNGERLIFACEDHLHRVRSDGRNLERITRDRAGRSTLAFSPDGLYLSFLQEGDLWLWNQETDELVQATRVAKASIGSVPGSRYNQRDVELGNYVWSGGTPYQWSPDSRAIALHYEDRRQMRKVPFPYYLGEETEMNVLRRGYPGDFDEIRAIAIYSLADGRFRLLSLPDSNYRLFNCFEWSPDGTRLLVDQSSEDGTDRWLYVATPTEGSAREVWHDRRDTRIYPSFKSAWRSDGKAVFFLGDQDEWDRLYVVPAEGGAAQPIARGDGDVLDMMVSADTKTILFASNQASPYERQIYRLPESGGAPQRITKLPGTHQPTLSPDGKTLALLRSNDTTPNEIYLLDLENPTAESRVTHSPPKPFDDIPWIQPKYVTFKSRTDDYTLHGRLVVPPDLEPGKKYPVILGPMYSNTVRNRWAGSRSTLQQYLALEGGYIGFQVDVRGSQGYGRSFREAFQKNIGGGDIEDLQSAVEYLETLELVDPDRIGIWGSSYGGTLTVMALFRKPGLFQAGVAGAPAVDARFFGTDDIALMGLPHTDPEVYRRISAIHDGEALEDHLLIIHGMQDSVVPFKTSVILAEKLMLLGKNFDFAFAPGAGHGWSRDEHYARFFLNKLVEHFDRYLGRGPR